MVATAGWALFGTRVMVKTEAAERQTKTGKPRSVSLDATQRRSCSDRVSNSLTTRRNGKPAWIGDGHVFARENGEPWMPNAVTRYFDQVVRTIDVPRIRLHDLRHSWATLALRAGVHPKVMQERLGHANISDHNRHLLPRDARYAGVSGRARGGSCGLE